MKPLPQPCRHAAVTACRAVGFVFLSALAPALPALAQADPLEATNLRLSGGSDTVLTWTPAAQAVSGYALYRGGVSASGMTGYDHACQATAIAGTSTRDAAQPAPGEAFYYLVTGLATDGAGNITAGRLGADGTGAAIPEATSITCGARIFVDPAATAPANGLTWASAYRTLAAALTHPFGSGRGLEIWTRGTLTDQDLVFSSAAHPGAAIRGGFAGTETAAWQRPATGRTAWQGGGAATLVTVPAGHSLALERMELRGAGTAVRAEGLINGTALLLDNLDAHDLATAGIAVAQADAVFGGNTEGRLLLLGSTFRAVPTAVRLDLRTPGLAGRLLGNTFTGTAGATDCLVAIRAQPGHDPQRQYSTAAIDVVANRFESGRCGLLLHMNVPEAGIAETTSLVASNVFRAQAEDAIVIAGTGHATSNESADVTASPVVIGNTIDGCGRYGIVTSSALTMDPRAISASLRVTPPVWNNIVSNCANFAVVEGAPPAGSPVLTVQTDIPLVGNDLFGNGGLFSNAGTVVNSLPTLNALPGNRANWFGDPLFVNRAAGDYRLAAGSPAIDRAEPGAPASVNVDAALGPRVRDGNGDGTAAADTGAHERVP